MSSFMKDEADGEGMGAAKDADGQPPAPEGKMWKRTKKTAMAVDDRGYMVTTEKWEMELVDAPKTKALASSSSSSSSSSAAASSSSSSSNVAGKKRPSPTKDDAEGSKVQRKSSAKATASSPGKGGKAKGSKGKGGGGGKQKGIASFFGQPKKKA